MTGALTVLYDRDCGLCRTIMGFLLARDGGRRLRPLALQAPEARTLLAGMSEAERMASVHVVDNRGRIASAGAALGPLSGVLPGGRVIASALTALPGLAALGYRIVAGNRARLGPLIPAAWRRRADTTIARNSRQLNIDSL